MINIDGDLENADWTKRTWDLVGIDSKPKLLAYLKSIGMKLSEFKKLPVYKFNVTKLFWLKKV